MSKACRYFLLCFLFFGTIQTVYAAPNAYVTTAVDTPITINVDVTETGAVSADTSAQGVTVSVSGTAPGTLSFGYTPPAGYNGVDSFNYHVGAVTATVTIQVGALASSSSVIGTPNEVMLNHIDDICTSANGQAPTALVDFCTDFSIATATEQAQILRELAPLELGGQAQLSVSQANQQIDNVRKRMANLRQGMTGTGNLFSGVNLHWAGKTYALSDFVEKPTGGAAAADGQERMGVFFNGKIGATDHDGSAYEDEYQLKNRALSAGLDYRFSDALVAGAALGNNQSTMDVGSNGGNVDSGGFSLLTYASLYLTAKTYVEAVVAVHKNNLESTRELHYTVQGADKNETANGQTDNRVLSFSLGTGYEAFSGDGLTLNVSANLDILKSAFDGYAENGAGDKNLVISKRELNQSTYSLNSQLTKAISYPSGVLIPQMDFTWKHEFEKDPSTIQAYYRADPTKTQFTMQTEVPDTDYFNLNLGGSYVMPGGKTAFVYYEKTLSKSGYSEYSFSIGGRIPIK